MNVSCNSLDQEILIENVVSRVFSISHESKYSMHARCVCERKPFRSSYFFLTKHVHWSRDEVVHTGTCLRVLVLTWQRTNSVTIDRVTAFDHEAIVRIRTSVIRSFCGLRLRSF